MFKKSLSLLLCVFLIGLSGCATQTPPDNNKSDTKNPTSATKKDEEEKETKKQNPLTGLYDLEEGAQYNRPVAVMINNLSTAQKVQVGLTSADIIYETEVEGGITRLMALYQDISRVGQIGTIRSARYAYVDLAMGHNAMYIHCGTDMTYCKPHLDDLDSVWIEDNECGGKRISNGLSREHTLYAYGDKVWEGLGAKGFDLKNSSVKLWQNFSGKNESVIPSDVAATNITVPFSNSYKTVFTYDESAERYTVGTRKDANTGEAVTVKNVFILKTSISNYPDGTHKKVGLESGTGYYISNGRVLNINWSKGKAGNGFTFTTDNGYPISVNAGNSWVCIVNKNNNVTIK